MAKPVMVVTTGDPVPRVLEERGDFARLIEEAIGTAWDGRVDAFDARHLPGPDPHSAAAYVITGSAAHVQDREPWVVRTEAWLRDVVAAGVPTLGICFGHQLLAQALGGEVQRNPRGREIGTVEIERLGDDPLFEGLPPRFGANATHLDSVLRLPPGTVVLARSSLEHHQALRFAPACYGVQFHPEIDGQVMQRYLEARREVLEAEAIDADALMATVGDAPEGRRVIENFLRHVVAHAPAQARAERGVQSPGPERTRDRPA
jgi:GMP synthase (glutamine-hydrolysing)